MSQLTFASVPGFFDLADTVLAADQPLTEDSLVKINQNAKAAALRPETFEGWFMDGETVGLPSSPVDGYNYSRNELRYVVAAWNTRKPAAGYANGTTTKPARADSNSGPGSIYLEDFWVEPKDGDNPGLVHCQVDYWDGSTETPTNDGMMKVLVIATRLSSSE